MNIIYKDHDTGNKLILGDCSIYYNNPIQKFEDLNVKTIICVKDYGFPLKQMGIQYVNLNVSHAKLFNEKNMFNMISFTNKYIEERLKIGSVYVHCRSGKNRSPIIIAAFLVYELGLTPDLALKQVKRKRREVEYTYYNVFSKLYKFDKK